ncbi:hypothetical protein D3C84_1283500 [compost metagenome]
MLVPPAPHMLDLLAAASQSRTLASTIANGFDDPRSFAPWWFDADHCAGMIRKHSSQAA